MRRPMLLVPIAVALCLSCKSKKDALVLVDVTGDAPFARGSTLVVSIASATAETLAKSFPEVTLETLFRAGIYLPGSVTGTVRVSATIEDGVCLRGKSDPVSIPGIASGQTVPPIALLVRHTATCEPLPDHDGGAPDGATGAGGAVTGAGGAGAGGRSAAGGATGSGGAVVAGSGGALGTGGTVASTGGTTGSGGTAVSTGGATGSGGALGATGGAVGTGGRPGTGGAAGGCGGLIDDMEAGTGYICKGSGRAGYWYTYIDTYAGSSIAPPGSQVPSPPALLGLPRGSSTRAMRASGSYSSYAGIGFLINAPVIDDPFGTFDATDYSGIRFYAMGTGGVRILVHTPATIATQHLGTCALTTCVGALSSSYFTATTGFTTISVPFSSLASGTSPFTPAAIAAIEFQPTNQGPFDLWIDDISFY